jgi:hypothetical protein
LLTESTEVRTWKIWNQDSFNLKTRIPEVLLRLSQTGRRQEGETRKSCTAEQGKGKPGNCSVRTKPDERKAKGRNGNDASSGKITGLSDGQLEGFTLNGKTGKPRVEENRKEGISQPE